jgi:tRNA(fMet)-specific endonuclease VapC
MREQPLLVLEKLQSVASQQHSIVISAITYAELRYGAIGKKSSPKHNLLVDAFVQRLDSILPWDVAAVDLATLVKKQLNDAGTPIGANDTAIAGHALAASCILVSNNTREFERVKKLKLEDWAT